ncbi:Utp21 specific WD40 associated putative domain-containing protein [Suillus subaureus]|uniref:Utp21 specific WD40 associated putative domain-containing protein n=1 Tax=Suillus subaureus TaxID=48587 RepID=A0A9P7EQ00_9AGAM|nr:Utp21 specific WD40 associated putative domain-containing protein [Suillus subaureus]KAG1827105.1 Utp21 specific WD40 associated putative domain-containing protein [Suillus subaureus]
MATQNAEDVDMIEARPRKRIRNSTKRKRATSPTRLPRVPLLFAPFRALGLITNHIPFYMQTRSYKDATEGPRIHILTCLGRSWALWEGGKMGLLFVGPEVQDPISCLVMDGDAVWAASGVHVIKYLRGKEVLRVSNPLQTPLAFVILFGSQLLALTEGGRRMLIWEVSTNVLVASSEGDMQLWNIRTQTCIHKFFNSQLCTLPTQQHMNSLSSPITALTQSPAIDVVGVGFMSGEISVYDVRADERLMRMYMDNGGIKALSFRSDGHSILASASSSGHIALWDLDSGGRLLHLIRGAHDGAVSALEWVPGQPVLVSSGEDNSVKQWLYESPTAVPRLLKFRSGHHAPPHLIRFYGEDGKQLLSASADRTLRYVSVVRDSRSYEMSQGSLARKATTLSKPLASLKFPPITSISCSSTRSKDWDDVLTAHADEMCVRSWTVFNKRVGKHTFNSAESSKRKSPSGVVKCVCVTACGNFGLAGSSTGEIHMWNMQSGLKRKSFKVGPCPQAVIDRLELSSMTKQKTSERSITGLASDALNRAVIATTSDGTMNFFNFHACTLDQVVVLPTPVSSIMLQRDSGLLAVVCDDMVVRIIDIETRRIVRELACGVHGRILDIAFSSDSRWIVVASLDSVIRTFDIPTGQLINAFRTPSVATSIAFSPTNDFLATTHVDSVGIFLWANRSQYSEVAFRAISEDNIAEVALPSMQGSEEDEALEALESLGVEDKPTDVFSTPSQLDGDLVTLTLLPRARWQTLLNLEVIQQRNKPKEPPKKPEHAPFFLPTLPGVEHRFAIEEKKQETQEKHTRRLDKIAANSRSTLQKLLVESDKNNGSDDALFNYIKSLSPAAIDLELRSLVSFNSLQQFLRAIKRRLQSHLDFEAVQALQNVVLRIHADVIIENEDLRAELEELLQVQKKESGRVLDLLASSLGTLGFVRDTQ